MTPNQPDAEKPNADQWRMLWPLERVADGDEVWSNGSWSKCYVAVGKIVGIDLAGCYRRRISPPAQSETPEADANAIECRQFDRNLADYVSLACGRRLERERDEARHVFATITRQLDIALENRIVAEQERDEARRERDEAKQQFEQYAGWSRWKPGLWLIMHPENSHDATWVAESMDELITLRAALAKAEQERDEALSRLTKGTL